MGNIVRMHVLVTGRVQGVNFRWFTQEKARALGVTGWVRNLESGHVEAEIEGDQASIDELLGQLHVGPRSAQVDTVEATPISSVKQYSDFEVRYDWA